MEILKLNKKNLKELTKKVCRCIKKGKVVICPTDTVYGFICNAKDKKAVTKVFTIKKREKEKPFPVFIADIKATKKLAKIDKQKEDFLKKIWPGKITVVLKREKNSKLFGIEKNTIALRIPKHDLLQSVLKKTKLPLVQTSVNISGEPFLKNPKTIIEKFNKQKIKPDLIIDGGILKKSKPSTIIDLTTDPPKILRK